MKNPNKTKTIASFSGLDPCGGAGISADIETACAYGIKILPIITNLTVQNTQGTFSIKNTSAKLLEQQFNKLTADIDIGAIKIGLLANNLSFIILRKILTKFKGLVVCDPIFKSSMGDIFLDKKIISNYREKILPKCTILTPNKDEFCALLGKDFLNLNNLHKSAILNLKTPWILVTSMEESERHLVHWLFHKGQVIKCFKNEKIMGNYHGSGCTLASAIACQLVLGKNIENACEIALEYTLKTIKNYFLLGKYQYHPNRFVKI